MAAACDHALFSSRTPVSTSIDTARNCPYLGLLAERAADVFRPHFAGVGEPLVR